MFTRLPFYENLRARGAGLGPGSKVFIKSLSVVSLGFALSKVFSSVATVIVARYFGPTNFGEARVVMLIAQIMSILMLMGLQVSVMKFGSGKDNPAPEVATVGWLVGGITLLCASVFWIFRVELTQYLTAWLTVTTRKMEWAILLAALFAGYGLLTSIYQTLNQYKQRGAVEVALSFLLLPGLILGYVLYDGNYETVVMSYVVCYAACIPYMAWRFRHLFSSRNLFSAHTTSIVSYGLFACLGNIGYVLTFLIQPLQIEWAINSTEVGIYTVYSSGSITFAAFASGIFYTVFFPKVSASQDRHGVWARLTKAWIHGVIPLFLLFAIIQVATVLASGKDYPLIWDQVGLFSLAATLITVQSTYGQIIASQGIRGIRWGLILSVISGSLNFLMSVWLIPKLGITGAVLAIIVNYAVTLLGTILCGMWLIRSGGLADA